MVDALRERRAAPVSAAVTDRNDVGDRTSPAPTIDAAEEAA